MARHNNLTYFTRNSLANESTDDKSNKEGEELEPGSDLEEGEQLPFIYGDVPPSMVSEPLEELDPYYMNKKTFLVLNQRKTIFRFNATPALFILSPFNLIRRLSIKVLVNFLFNVFLMSTYVINCIFMTMYTSPAWAKTLMMPFVGLYTFQILIEILARGFSLKHFTFLYDPWSWFDILILSLVYWSIFVNLGNYLPLGIFSVLRIVKALFLKGPRSLLEVLNQSMKMFYHTVILIVFSLSFFAVLGMQLFMGKLKQKCLRWPRAEGNVTQIWDNEDYFYHLEGQSDALLCGNSTYAGECPEGYMCVKAGLNPDHNYTSFDNFGWALLTLFRLMSLDYWENLYQQTLRAAGKAYMIFFVIVIFFCSFFLMTLILAVVILAYGKQNKISIKAIKRRKIKYQAMLYRQKRGKQEAQEMVVEGMADIDDPNTELSENSSETPQCISESHNERMDQRKKRNQEAQPDRKEKEIDLKLHRFETEDFIKRKIAQHGIKKQKLTKESKLSSPQQGRTVKTEEKEEQISSCRFFMDLLDDPTIRKRLKRRTDILNTNERPNESRSKNTNWWDRFVNTCMVWNYSQQGLKYKDFFYTLVTDPFFDLVIAICVVINLLFMAMEHYPISEKFYNVLSVGNLVFAGIYTAEMLLKIIALQPCNYFQIGWNMLDSFIVLLALAELCTMKIYVLPLMKSLRLLRIFKMAKYWPTCERLMKIIVYSIDTFLRLFLLLLITIFIFAVVGMHQFGGSCQNPFHKIDADCLFSCWHKQDFIHSLLMIFRVLCGEWIKSLWDCMDITIKNKCLIFYLLIIIIGKMMLLILFVALLSSFSSENFAAIQVSPESNNLRLAMSRIQKGIYFMKRNLLDIIVKGFSKKQMISNDKKSEENVNMENKVTSSHMVYEMDKNQHFQNNNVRNHSIGSSSDKYIKEERGSPSLIHNPNFSVPGPISFEEPDLENVYDKELRNELKTDSHKETQKGLVGTGDDFTKIIEQVIRLKGKSNDYNQTSSPEDSMAPILASGKGEQVLEKTLKSDEPGACFVYGCIRRFPYCEASVKSRKGKIWWNLRKTCYRTVTHGCFEISIVFITLLGCIALIFEDIYIEKRKTIKIILEYGDMIFTYIFILEMLLKWMAYGCKTYFSNIWCWLEFLVVNVSLVSLVTTSLGYSELAPLKTLRMLRILSIYEGVRVVLHLFSKAIPSVLKAILVCLMCWLFFSLMGVSLFAGKFFKCVNTTSGERLSRTIVINFSECKKLINSTGDIQWKNEKANFDNIGNAFLSLLHLATFQGWLDIMHAAVDAVDVESQPEYENNIYICIYFVSFIIFGLFFPLVFFISVVINHFKQQIKMNIFMTKNQKKFYNWMKKSRYWNPQKSIPRPENKFQGFIFDLITKEAFEIIIIVLICLNIVAMMVETDSQSAYQRSILYYVNLVFFCLFVGECVLKLIGLRHYYFTIAWNVFDFMAVHLCIKVVLQPHLTNKYLLTYGQVQVIRLIRCGRILTFIKGTKGMGLLIYALMLSLPALLNIVLLLIIVMFIYAILGMSHFAYVKKDAGINDMFNFETFGNSILCLFQMTTFAGWDGLLAPILNTGPPDCDPEKIHPGSSVKGDCGSPSFGIFYFVSYIIISFLVLVNMFVIVILKICSVVSEENAKSMNEEAFDNFYEVWQQFDPQGTHFIDYSQLSEFAASLDPPLLITKPNKIQLIAMDLPMVRGDRVFCSDVLIALTKHVMSECEEFDHLRLPMREQFLSSCLFQVSYEPITTTLKRKHEEVSATVIQRAFRRFHLRQKVSGTHNIKGRDRVKMAIKENTVFDNIHKNSALEKMNDLSSSTISLSLDSVIEQEGEKNEKDQTEKEDKGESDRDKKK